MEFPLKSVSYFTFEIDFKSRKYRFFKEIKREGGGGGSLHYFRLKIPWNGNGNRAKKWYVGVEKKKQQKTVTITEEKTVEYEQEEFNLQKN